MTQPTHSCAILQNMFEIVTNLAYSYGNAQEVLVEENKEYCPPNFSQGHLRPDRWNLLLD